MADYVNYMSDGDRSIILTTGYEPSKDTRTPVVIEPVTGFALEYGDNPGTINLSVKRCGCIECSLSVYARCYHRW